MKANFFLLSTGLLFVCITMFQNLIHAQEIVYAYDASGNRVERSIVFPPRIGNPDASGEALNETVFYDSFSDVQIKIYPNPTEGLLSIETVGTLPSSAIDVRMYDLAGKLVFSRGDVSSTTTIDISGLGKGNYVLRLQQGKATREWKIVKM